MIKMNTCLRVLSGALCLAFLGTAVLAADKNPNTPLTDPAQGGLDFQLQGEYTGQLEGEDVGLHVLALKDRTFRAVLYTGGLPGAGWDQEHKTSAETKLAEDSKTLAFKLPQGELFVSDGAAKIAQGDKLAGKLNKVERTSPSLGAKPPEAAVVLFDGSSAEKFKGGRISDDGLLMQGVTSHDKFGDFFLHMEFRTPFMPQASGQGRGNSGCYLQGRYEVQVLDSFGLEGKNNECGGIYETRDPDVNMCLPPLAWQTYDIDYTAARYDEQGNKTANARITVYHNGIAIHEDVELPKGTRAHPVKEGPEPGPIYLQDHGNPVRYRNIWLVEKKPGQQVKLPTGK